MNSSDDALRFRSAHAIRGAIPTRVHAEMLFHQVEDLLGERAWVESWNDGQSRTLHVREEPGSSWVVPWPVLTISRGGRTGPAPLPTGVPGVYHEPPRRAGRAPRLRGLGPGSVALFDGRQRVALAYGADGRWFECSTSAPPAEALAGAVAALETRSAAPLELLSAFLADLGHARHGSGRVWMPVPLPGGIAAAWNCGLRAIRRRLFASEECPPKGCIAADGWTGRAVATGATRDESLARWRRMVEELRPFPAAVEASEDTPTESSIEQTEQDGGFSVRATLVGPRSDVPPVEPTVDNSPAAVTVLPRLPRVPPARGEWAWVVDGFGNPRPAALLRSERGGFTMIGRRLVDVLDLDVLEARLDAADADWESRGLPAPVFENRPPLVPTDTETRTYRVLDDEGRPRSRAAVAGSSRSVEFDAASIDADALEMRVLRVRHDRG